MTETNMPVKEKYDDDGIIVSDNHIIDKFKEYLTKYYYNEILGLYARSDKILYIKTQDLSDELLPYFFEIDNNNKIDTPTIKHNIKLLTEAARLVYSDALLEENYKHINKIQVRFIIDDKLLYIPINRINLEDHGNRLIVFEGLINGTSPTKATVRERVFECRNCRIRLQEKLSKCPGCGNSGTIYLSMKRSGLINLQFLDIQERLDVSSNNVSTALAQPIMVKVTGDLAGKFNIGDIVRVIGFAMPVKAGQTTDVQLTKTIEPEFADDLSFDIIVEAHNIERLSSSVEALLRDPSSFLSQNDITAIQKLRQKYDDETLLQILVNSFAPHIYGLADVKEAIMLQLVGSIPINKKREFIHILLVGDPGTAKSEILNYAYEIALHKAKAVGRGSSGVGLTAGIGNDKRGVNKISAGAAVLADRGLCVVDEFANISDENQSYLLESMEHGKFTMTKVISATFNTRTTFLMAMNPVSGKYSEYNSLKDNIELTDQLISRFDLIFVILDKVDRKHDRKMSGFVFSRFDPTISSSYHDSEACEPNSPDIRSSVKISEELLKKYLVYARINNLEGIKIERDALKHLQDFYNDLRTPTKSSDVTATLRQADGMARLSFALTRLLLKDRVTLDIARHITQLLARAYQSCGLIVENALGMNQTATYSRPLDKVNPTLRFTMVMDNLTNGNTEYTDKEAVILELVRKGKMEFDEAYKLWDKMDRDNLLHVNNNKFKMWNSRDDRRYNNN
jgi:replicative DNA helicase Mcm